ncbi:MAG: Septum formation initiator, secreted protein [Parcubacteria group bacterium GW2011_GWA2_39_18]|nr:MAG: Septum formation initiator, secreted protein [Parcubacteria group bacterium GW2011_GWA2_39_18]
MKKSIKQCISSAKETGSAMQWVLVALLSVIVVSLVFSITKIGIRYWQARSQVSSLQKDIIDISKEQNNIQNKLNSQKDPAFLELEAREKFNYQLPGEHVFVFLESTSSLALEKNNLKDKIIFWAGKLGENPKNWAKYFFGVN